MAKIGIEEYTEKISRLIEQHSLEQAAHHCFYLLRQFPRMQSLYQLLGRIFLETGNYSGALDIYLRLVSCNPETFLNHITLSFIYEKLKRPQQSVFFGNIGNILQTDFSEKQDLPFVLDDEDQGSSSKPEVIFAKGKYYFDRGDFQNTLDWFKKNPTPRAFILDDYYLGLTYTQLSLLTKALTCFQDLLVRAPTFLAVLRWTASAYYEKNEVFFAKILEKLIEIDPNYAAYNFENDLIVPGKADIPVNYQDWTGFPNTRLWSGWSRSGDKYIDNTIDALPKWLTLLPVCQDFLINPANVRDAPNEERGLFQRDHAQNKPALSEEDHFFQIDYFKSQVMTDNALQKSQQKSNKQHAIKPEEKEPYSGLDEAFNLLEKVAVEGFPEREPEEEAVERMADFSRDIEPDDTETLAKAREAWNCFSTGRPEEGIRIYEALMNNSVRSELIQEDIKKLIILFPEYQELSKFINDEG